MMNEKVLYSITGIFDKPNDIIKAAKTAVEKGYTKYDTHTPYPIHGMPAAMKLPPSRLGYVALVFGLTGTIIALTMMYWMSAVDYPHVIGGKPYFPFPAYVPIMFELTVLLAAVLTVKVMLTILFKLPNNNHPLHDSDYMKKVSSDKLGISIEAKDPKFNEQEVMAMLKDLGAVDITPIYFDDEEYTHKHKILEPKFISLLVVLFVLVSGGTYITLNKVLYLPPFNWMHNQEKLVAQDNYSMFADGFAQRPPVEGTISRGNMPYFYFGKPDEAAKSMVNPLLPSKENLELGKAKYDTYCSPCHGYFGEGDSRLRGQFPNPPSLHSEKVRNEWTDGRIYHVIMEGQNVMPSYASQLTREERWATILYVRALQRSLNAKEADLQ